MLFNGITKEKEIHLLYFDFTNEDFIGGGEIDGRIVRAEQTCFYLISFKPKMPICMHIHTLPKNPKSPSPSVNKVSDQEPSHSLLHIGLLF